MKSLKKILVAACVLSATASLGLATDVHTLAGTMTVPDSLTASSVSTMDSVSYAKDGLAKELQKSTLKRNDRVDAQNMLNLLNQAGVSYDVYQLNGEDSTGQKDALLVAVDLKTVANELNTGKQLNPIINQVASTLNAGQLDPVTEQLFMASVNMVLPKEKTIYPLPNKKNPTSVYINTGKDKSLAYGVIGKDKKESSVTVEDTELMTKLDNTKYQTYTVGSRVSLDAEGLVFPYYAKAAIVMNPSKPTLYLAVTSDVQRQYFMPIFDNAFKSIK